MHIGDTVYVATPRHVNSADFDQVPNEGWKVEWFVVVSFDDSTACLLQNGFPTNMCFIKRSRVFLTETAAQEMADYHRDRKHTIREICLDPRRPHAGRG